MGECSWELALVIPASSFFAHQLKDFNHMEATGNFYKCGDKLETPHFLSWHRLTCLHLVSTVRISLENCILNNLVSKTCSEDTQSGQVFCV